MLLINLGEEITKKDHILPIWKLYIIERAIPFGKQDNEEEESNAFKKIMDFNTEKYNPIWKKNERRT
jgi:hypothetical protein